MGPFDMYATLGHVGGALINILVGAGFGFALERAGFGNSLNLAAQFYFRNMRVLKVMFTAIVTAMLLIFWANALGLVDYEKVWVNPTYMWPGILGGIIFGIGFVIGGYCPGTALVSMATLKIDGILYVAGLCIGMFFFGETIDGFRAFWEHSGFLGRLTIQDWLGVSAGTAAFIVVLMAIGMFIAAEKTEAYFAKKDAEAKNG